MFDQEVEPVEPESESESSSSSDEEMPTTKIKKEDLPPLEEINVIFLNLIYFLGR